VLYLSIIKNEKDMKTFKDLKIGTIAVYNDMANVDLEFVILDSYTDRFGEWVNIMNLDSRTIEPKSQNSELGNRWTIKQTQGL
jgi:hypothetical protein